MVSNVAGGRTEMSIVFIPSMDSRLTHDTSVVEDQYHEILGSSNAWGISDDTEAGSQATILKSTNSARRVKALFEQVTGRVTQA